MAQRSANQETFKGIEVLMRLALKAQAQARSTAEALALLKNPQPYIRQANMTTGPQQVNNTYASTPSHSGIQSGAGNMVDVNYPDRSATTILAGGSGE
jgi:hypothetical protein